MRLPLLLISVAFIGSVYFFITNENRLNTEKQESAIPALSNIVHSAIQPTEIASNKTKEKIPVNGALPKPDTLLQDAQGQTLMTAITAFWQQCRRQNNCDELLAKQQLLLDDARYQLLVNFPVNQQREQGLMGASLMSQDASLADKIANVKAIREQVWGDDTVLLFQQQDRYYDYRLSLTDPDSRFNQTQNADDFISEYKAMLEALDDDLASFSLNSDTAKYEEALRLIPSTMPEHEAVRIKDELASQYQTTNDQQAIRNREQQIDAQNQDVTDYQQGLSQLEISLSSERDSANNKMTDEDWLAYKADRLYQYRLDFFGS